MLSALVIVAFIATATSCAYAGDVHEYSAAAVERFTTTSRTSQIYSAQLTKTNTAIPFRKGEHQVYDGALPLYSELQPDFASKDLCKTFFGIEVPSRGTYCNITSLTLWLGEYEKEDDGLEFSLQMRSSFTKPFRVDIPVFKIPDSLTTKTPAELERWAADNKVGLISPLTNQEIDSIILSNRVWLKFDWLAELLKLGLFDSDLKNRQCSRCGADYDVYVSRPVVLHIDTVTKLIRAADKQNRQNIP